MMGGSIYAQKWYFTYTVIPWLTRFSIARISITCYEDYICYLRALSQPFVYLHYCQDCLLYAKRINDDFG